MKKGFLFIICICIIGIASAQNSKSQSPEIQIRKYWFVMLSKGPSRNQDSARAAKIQAAHMDNINRLYKLGKLKVAGPFEDSDKWSGIFIFDCPTREEVELLLKSDSAVSSGRLSYEIQAWYTSPVGSFRPGKPTIKK